MALWIKMSSSSSSCSTLRDLASSCLSSRRRHFARSLANSGHWKNETPSGGLTELYVYTPESDTIWPDPRLSVFADQDPRFPLPGHVGLTPIEPFSTPAAAVTANSVAVVKDDNNVYELLNESTNRDRQARTLSSAKEFIKYTYGADVYLCKGILDRFPEFPGMKDLRCELHEAPTLLKKQIQLLFPERKLEISNGNVSVISLSQKTFNDMSEWSDEMEEEREELAGNFVEIAKEICARMTEEGYWADFIDPSSGTPYFGNHSSNPLFETDENYRLLGFRIEDLGCCKVITHKDFGRKVFVGIIFTNAHPAQGVIQDMFQDLRMDH